MSAEISPDISEVLQARLSIVIPAFNEEAGIAETLGHLREAFPFAEILVIDDGSADATARVAAGFAGITVIRHPFNLGYGAALKTGMRQAKGDFIAWFDADNEHRADDLRRMVSAIGDGGAAAVIGQRARPGGSGVRTFGKLAIRLLARCLGFKAGSDINCGLRVFDARAIRPYLKLLPNGYSASITSLMILMERGYPVRFEPVTLNPRLGESKVVLADGLQAVILVLRTIMLFAPLRIFLGLGLVLMALGLAYGITLALMTGRGVPTAAVLSVLSGLLFCLQGLIADQISQMRLNQLEEGGVEGPGRADEEDMESR
jgi:glycosyltransferase involved in cell wall biosynthesis